MRIGIAVFLVCAAATACGGSSTKASPATIAPTTADATSNPPVTTATSPAATSVADRLAAAGIDCHGQQFVGDVDCTFKGKKVTVSFTSWAGTEALRKRACDEGYVNTGYVVAVANDRLTVSADYNEVTQAIAQRLDAQVVTYCPS